MPTQLQLAQKKHITDAMKAVAQFEQVEPRVICEHVAQGKIVIPANIKHLATNLKPVGIGRLLSTKINANIGTSSEKSSVQGELDKMAAALEVGADAMMDLSTGGDLGRERRRKAMLLEHQDHPDPERLAGGKLPICATVGRYLYTRRYISTLQDVPSRSLFNLEPLADFTQLNRFLTMHGLIISRLSALVKAFLPRSV